VLYMVIWYFLAIRFRWYAIVCSSSSDVAIRIWSSAYSMVFRLLYNMKECEFLVMLQQLLLKWSPNFCMHNSGNLSGNLFPIL
jgi:hypothetical protein